MIERLECARKEIVEGAHAQLAPEADVPPAVAVLPFVNMSADMEQDYFCYGIAEDIINGLTQVEGLRVVARTSAFAFKGKTGDVREIGEKLDVSAVLEGSVRKSGNKLRITAQLINVADGFHLWSDRYDRELEDVFAIQDEISQSIVRMLKVKLIGEPEQAIVKRYTKNLDAYTLYLKGRFYWSKRSEDSLKKGMEYFEMAIEEDPNYALAYAGLADSFNLLGFYNVEPPDEVFPKAMEVANKAIAMDDSLAEPYTSLAFAKMLYEWDWEGAEQAFKRSLELNPDYPTGNHWYAEYLVFTGQTEAVIVQAARTLETDPLSLIINTLLGWVPYFARQYDEAVKQYSRTLEMDAEFVPAHFFLGLAYAQQSKYEKALAELQLASKLFGRSTLFMQAQAYTLGLSGRRYEAETILNGLETVAEKEYVSPYFTAVAYAGLGDMDRVFEWLDRACEQRDIWMVFLKVDPIWDDLRPEPMFAALLKRVGLGAKS
jgi:TolB-like protein/Tfp pilus assembly protein PilF